MPTATQNLTFRSHFKNLCNLNSDAEHYDLHNITSGAEWQNFHYDLLYALSKTIKKYVTQTRNLNARSDIHFVLLKSGCLMIFTNTKKNYVIFSTIHILLHTPPVVILFNFRNNSIIIILSKYAWEYFKYIHNLKKISGMHNCSMYTYQILILVTSCESRHTWPFHQECSHISLYISNISTFKHS